VAALVDLMAVEDTLFVLAHFHEADLTDDRSNVGLASGDDRFEGKFFFMALPDNFKNFAECTLTKLADIVVVSFRMGLLKDYKFS